MISISFGHKQTNEQTIELFKIIETVSDRFILVKLLNVSCYNGKLLNSKDVTIDLIP